MYIDRSSQETSLNLTLMSSSYNTGMKHKIVECYRNKVTLLLRLLRERNNSCKIVKTSSFLLNWIKEKVFEDSPKYGISLSLAILTSFLFWRFTQLKQKQLFRAITSVRSSWLKYPPLLDPCWILVGYGVIMHLVCFYHVLSNVHVSLWNNC